MSSCAKASRRTRRSAFWIVLAGASLTCAACSSDPEAPCGEPIYAGLASDEAWRTMVDARALAVADAANGATITSPAEGSTVMLSAGALVLRWSSDLHSSLSREPNSPILATTRGHTATSHFSWTDLLITNAWAHLPPVTGAVHDLSIRIPGRECPVEVLTTERTITLDPAAMTALQAATGQTVELEIVSAYLRENRITEGPFKSATPHHLVIAP